MNLHLDALEARALHDTLAYLLHPLRVQDDPDSAALRSAFEKIGRFVNEAFCNQERCYRPTYSKGMCEPCYRASRRKTRRLLKDLSDTG